MIDVMFFFFFFTLLKILYFIIYNVILVINNCSAYTYLSIGNRCIICLNMTLDDNSNKRKDDASSSLSVMTASGLTPSTSSNATTIGSTEGCSPEGGAAKNDTPGTSLDFIGTSNAVKKLFSMSLDSSPSISSSSSSKKISTIAIHNFDGTLIIDDAEDESNYDDYCQFNRNNRGNYYASSNTSKKLLPPRSQSLALALSALSPTTTDDDTGTIGLQQKSILSSIGFQPEAIGVMNNSSTAKSNNIGSNKSVKSPTGDDKSYNSDKERLPSSSALLAPPMAPREFINWKFKDLNLLVGHEALIVRPPTTTTTTTTEAACDGSQQQQHQRQNAASASASASDAGIAVRVEDLQFLQNAWKVFQQQQQQQHAMLSSSTVHQSNGNSSSNTKATVSEQRSYAQALLQKREEVSSTSISSSPSKNDQNNPDVDRQLDGADNDNDNGDGFIAPGDVAEKDKKKDNESLSDLPLQTCIVPFTGPLGGRLSSIESSSSSSSSDPTTNSATGINDYPSPALSIVLDAYLDNLMANVPQLALCLQEKGLIQSVKLLPTEVIPSMMLHPSTLDTTLPLDIIHSHSNSSSNNNHHRRSSNGIKTEDMFSPKIMEMNASALMRFLKTNCTRNHATYLLRHETLSEANNNGNQSGNNGRRNKQHQQQKQHNIHLYDISSISTQGQRKWIWWLATMSFRFALRLRHLESSASSVSESHKRAIRDRQRSLYQQTLDLLQDLMDVDGNAHESMVASVREHMADTYLSSVVGGREVVDNNPSTESTEWKNTTPTATSTRNASSPSELPSSPSPPVVTMTTTSTNSSLNSINSARLSQPEYSPTIPSADSTNIRCKERQPYATLTIDALNKAHDHLVCGIKTLSSLFERDLEERRLYQEAKKLEEEAVLKRSRRRQRPRAQHKVNSGSKNQEEKDGQIPKLSPAMMMQLFGMNYKLVNISLRLAEHHLGNYYSSSAMQALRSAARRLVDAAHLLDYYEIEMKKGEEFGCVSQNGDNREDEKWQESLQLQYIWLLEHCGHFARSFASDELWRDRGHTSGDDVVQILRDVENAFVDHHKTMEGKYDKEDGAHNRKFWKMVLLDALVEKSKGNVSLQSLSAIVAPFNMNAKESEEAIAAAREILAKQRVLQRERRKVLVASCVSYSRAITALQCIVALLDQKDPTNDKLVLLNLLRQRLGDACNEVGKVLLAALRTLLASNQGRNKDDVSQLAAEVILDSAEFWFAQGLESFKACHDMRNLALLRCNLCQSYKLRANSGFAKRDSTSSSKHAEDCLQQAANQLLTAHEDLNQRDVDPRTWDMVSEQLASTFLVLGVRRRQSLLGGGNAPVIFQVMRLSPGEERSILDPMTRALEIYQQSDNNHQAAATHYQLALTFSKLWTCQLNESNTRKKLSKAFEHYSLAFTFFSNNFRGNEPTFCLLCLDLASLYAAIPGEEGLIKALGCCLDSCDAFSMDSSSKATVDCYDKMATIAASVDDRVFKLLRSLVKIDANLYKDLYREGLTAKMVRNVPDDDELDVNPKAAALLTLYEVLCAIKKKYGVIVSK